MQKLTKFRALQYTLTNGTNALDLGNLDYLSCVFPRGCHLIIIWVLHIRGIYARNGRSLRNPFPLHFFFGGCNKAHKNSMELESVMEKQVEKQETIVM